MEKSTESRKPKYAKWTLIIVLAFFLIWPLTVGLYWLVYQG